MKIGVPRESKNNESRVGMTPAGVFELIKNNHTVYVQENAGFGSGFWDTDYAVVGAIIVPTAAEVYDQSDMIVKVKEPIAEEYPLIKPNQIVFTYFHFASSEELTIAMLESKSVCIVYETVEDTDGSLPLLTPISEVAGIMAIQQGAVPYTSILELTNSTLPYVIKIANLGWKEATNRYPYLQKGLNVVNGEIFYKELVDIFKIS
jgi:alanine dehydrogenase